MSVHNSVNVSEECLPSKSSLGRPPSPPKYIPTPFASYPSTPTAAAPLANNFVYTKHKSPNKQSVRISEKLRNNALDGKGKGETPVGLPKLKDRRKPEKAERFRSSSRSPLRSPARSEAAFQSAFPPPSNSHTKLVQAKNDFGYDPDDVHLPDPGHSNDPTENYTRSKKLRAEYEQAMVEKALRTKKTRMRLAEDRRSVLIEEVHRGIEEFEHKNAKEMRLEDDDDMDKEENTTGRSSAQDKLDPESIKSFLALQSTLEPVEHIKALQRMLPSSKATKLQCKEYTEKIKEKKIEEEMARKEREQRQRKMILDQQNAQKLLEEANREEHLLRKLMRQSRQERRIAQQLMSVRHEKEVVRNNRIFRAKQYQECRQRDYEKALEREAQICAQARLEFQRQTEMQSKQYKAILDQKAERKKKNHFAMCLDITRQLIDLALRMSDCSNLNDGMVPPKIMREWKMLFQAGRPLTKDSLYSIKHDWIETSGVVLEPSQLGAVGIAEGQSGDKMNEETMEGIKLLDEEEFLDYLTGKGDWTMTEGEAAYQGPNDTLGRVVSTILDLTSQVDATSRTPALPAVPLQLSIVGKRFSGKSTLAEQLASTYGLTVIVMDVLITEAISAHEANEMARSPSQSADAKASKRHLHSTPSSTGNLQQGVTSAKQSSRPVPSQRAQLGGKVEMAMLEGGSPDDSLLVALVVEAIKEVGAQQKAGWVLVNFPRNKTQAQLLEKELSGYEDPKPVKPGGLKRQTVKDKLAISSKKKSLIAPTRNDGEDTPSNQPVSGIDQVIYLDIDNDVAFKRSAGRRIDSLTGEMYNFDTAPPPKNVPGLNERLVAVDDEGGKDTQLQYQLASFEDQIEPLCEWYSRFQNMKTIAGTLPPSQVTEKANACIQEMISKKEKSREERAQEATAKEKEHAGSKIEVGKTETEVSEVVPNNEGDIVGAVPPVQITATAERKPPTAGERDTPKVEPDKVERKRGPSAKGTIKDMEKNRTLSASFGQKEKDRSTRNLAAEVPAKEKRNPSAGREKRPITTGATESAVLKEEPPPTPVQPIVRPVGVDGRKLPSKDLAEILADQWATIETSFTETMKFSFRSLRKERDDALHHFHGLKESFHRFLERPDQKQEFVEVFQQLYNEMENDLRSDPDAKAELHQRVEDLRDKLWEISDQRKEEAESERQSHIDDRWVEDHYANLNNIYITMMQAEVDRYIGTKQVLTDYFKDSHAETIDENTPASVIVPMISSQSLPETIINLGGAPTDSMRGNRPIAPNSAGIQGRKGAGGGQNSHGKKGLGKTSSERHIQAIPTSEQGVTESDLEKFAEIQAVFEAAVAVTYPLKETSEKEVNEKSTKKKNTQVVEVVVESKEVEPELPVECVKAIEFENQLLRKRLERVRRQGIEHLKELANKGLEVFNILDDCIGLRFQAEMDAIKDLVNVIREAIESEVKLPNELVLEGEKFQVDYRVLTYEPEPEPRPESPVEKPTPDGFTVLQLLNLGQQFRDCAPAGNIPAKDFIEGVQRLAVFTIGLDVLPESWMSTDQTQLNQLAATFDPYGTGNVNWKSFLLTAAKILPISLADLQQTRDSYRNAPSWNNGTISKEDFMLVPLWFETLSNTNDQPSPADEPTSKFNRPAKMKSALFHLFAQSAQTTMIDNKAAPLGASPEAKSAEFTDVVGSKQNETGNSLGNGVPLLGEHGVLNDEDLLFDVTDFLLSICLDEQPKVGVQKAFLAGSIDNQEGGALSVLQLYRVFHHGLSLVSETHRLTGDANAEDPFPMEVLQKVVDESGENGMISFDPFSRATEGQPDFLNCPLYQIEEIPVGKVLG